MNKFIHAGLEAYVKELGANIDIDDINESIDGGFIQVKGENFYYKDTASLETDACNLETHIENITAGLEAQRQCREDQENEWRKEAHEERIASM